MFAEVSLVWFRRDLRLGDHRALGRALAESAAVVPVFVLDDALLHHPLTGSGRVQFMLDALGDLDAGLRRCGSYLVTRRGVPHEELLRLAREVGATRVYYHEDTDRMYGRERDEQLQRRLGSALEAIAVPDNGVFFASDARQDWAKKWEARMAEAPVPPPEYLPELRGVATLGISCLADLGLPPSDKEAVPPGGETWARRRLEWFLQCGVRQYRATVGKPWESEQIARGGTSRLSGALSFGCLSLRSVVQASERAMAACPEEQNRVFWHSRLYWHDHFTQKQRDWPRAQWETINPVYNEIRQTLDAEKFAAWTEGQTGYPLVDASMRALKRTGFLNFRMRAMVAAFLTYDLWQPWQAGAEWFQKHLIDFDTGINHQQWQMQAGCVGTHANRFYDPTKQLFEFDPWGLFVARYVPELATVPMPQRAQPWCLTAAEQARWGIRLGRDYPFPIVDHAAAVRLAQAEFKRLAPAARAFVESAEGRKRVSSERRLAPPEETAPLPCAAVEPPQLALF